MKKIMLIGLIILSVFLIYLCNLDRKVYYLSLNGSDIEEDVKDYSTYVKNYLEEKDVLEIYVPDYSTENLKIIDLINNINDNKEIKKDTKEITLKNSLIKADLVTLSFSLKDVFKRANKNDIYDYIDDLSMDLDKLLDLMREYCKEDIILVGYYNPYPEDENIKNIVEYINKQYGEICKNHNVDYINLEEIFEGHSDFISENNLPSQMGENIIASNIIDRIDKNLLKG